ncbi:MAG: peptide chain release factor 1 [Xanthomonadales bacterium]|nr:peptide chain release factor 1 [Xanthomonadales bacterium]
MKTSIVQRLQRVAERYEEIALLLAQPEAFSDPDRFRNLSREYAQIEPVVLAWKNWRDADEAIDEARQFLAESDLELRRMAAEDIRLNEALVDDLEQQIQLLLLPTDPNDQRNIFLEIRAGTGGDEAAIFAGDLFRMYQKYAERQGWNPEIISTSYGEHGGFKEIIVLVEGDGAFSRMKFESGTHRVQRVPETESQGRIHTSACTVAILPEAEDVAEIDLNPAEMRIDTFRASGAGGQHINKTDSAIRVTHFPTGIVIECQDERSQHKNKARALSLLKARVLELEQSKQAKEISDARRLQVGSGDRSQRVRTYNYPQGRVTDHRINLTLYKLDEILGGNLNLLVDPLTQEQQADLLAQLGD